MTGSKINLIIVCYNCGGDIVGVLSDLKEGVIPLNDLSVNIVDNNSSDNSIELLKAVKGIDINLIESPDNVGFGAGCNLAMPYLSAPRTLLLNPDVRLNPQSIKNLLDFSDENPKSLIWGGKTVGLDGKVDGKSAWKEPTFWGVISWAYFVDVLLTKCGKAIPDAYTEKELTQLEFVDAISGCFFLIETTLFKKLGGFDERFFMYSEEIDLCRRARKAGARPQVTNRASVIHEGSKTIAGIDKLNFLYYSKLKYAHKYWPTYQFQLARMSIFLGSVIRCVIFFSLFLLKSEKGANVKAWSQFVKLQTRWTFY